LVTDLKIVLNPALSMQNQNAAHADGSAGTSEELNAQAGQIKLSVDKLAVLIGDETNGEMSNHYAVDSGILESWPPARRAYGSERKMGFGLPSGL
jgi:hypothetical protein